MFDELALDDEFDEVLMVDDDTRFCLDDFLHIIKLGKMLASASITRATDGSTSINTLLHGATSIRTASSRISISRPMIGRVKI